MTAKWEALGRMAGSLRAHDAVLGISSPVECGEAIVSLCDSTAPIPVENRPRRSTIVGTFRGDPVAVDDYGNVFLGKGAVWRTGRPSGSRDVALVCDGTIVDVVLDTGSTDVRAYSLDAKWGVDVAEQ